MYSIIVLAGRILSSDGNYFRVIGLDGRLLCIFDDFWFVKSNVLHGDIRMIN